MPVLIKQTSSYTIEFDNGSFDEWCVYLTTIDRPRYAPKDIDYFNRLQQLGVIYGHAKIFNDFIRFYIITGKQINDDILTLINTISFEYVNHAEEIEILFVILYAGMIAEEN